MSKTETCGYERGCTQLGEVRVLSDIGGYFGHLCNDHADELNQRLEHNMEQNRALLQAMREEAARGGAIIHWLKYHNPPKTACGRQDQEALANALTAWGGITCSLCTSRGGVP